MANDTLYLLYYGTSEDGRGQAKYVGRTDDPKKAVAHWKTCVTNPYCNGYVVVLTENTDNHATADYWESIKPRKK